MEQGSSRTSSKFFRLFVKTNSVKDIELYQHLVLPRMVEEHMLLALRRGDISKWFSGIGQEAISVGCTLALRPDEYLLTVHRNLGVFTTRQVPLERLFQQFLGKPGGYTRGRDRSFHFGVKEHHIVGMISHLAVQLTVANGLALAHQLNQEKRVCLAFTGEGATSEGDFHEALNVASVWELPVIFVIENNGYALSTPPEQQYRCQSLADRGHGYGMKSLSIDGNDVNEVLSTVSSLASEIRENPRPALLECRTFRMRGHEEASGVRYVPTHKFEEWAPKDPLLRLESKLLEQGVPQTKLEQLQELARSRVGEAWEKALQAEGSTYQVEIELEDRFAPTEVRELAAEGETYEARFVDALNEAHKLALERYPNLIIMGQDVGQYGGVFKVTDGLLEAYGRQRVRNTPLCESAIVGSTVGLSLEGYKSIVEMQFADFASCAFNQLFNNLAKLHYRWGQNVDTVIRMPTGGGLGAGPLSQSIP